MFWILVVPEMLWPQIEVKGIKVVRLLFRAMECPVLCKWSNTHTLSSSLYLRNNTHVALVLYATCVEHMEQGCTCCYNVLRTYRKYVPKNTHIINLLQLKQPCRVCATYANVFIQNSKVPTLSSHCVLILDGLQKADCAPCCTWQPWNS